MEDVQVFVNAGGLDAPVDLLRRGVRAALARESVTAGEISLALLDDVGIRELNRRYLDRDHPTDVIAFPLYEPEEPVVGDVYVGVDQARRQAAELEIPLDEELLRLVVHGTLHVLGHEHPEDGERQSSEMFRIQEELVRAVLAEDGRNGPEDRPRGRSGGEPRDGPPDGPLEPPA